MSTPSAWELRLYGQAVPARLGLLRIAVGLYWLVRLVQTRGQVAEVVRVSATHFTPVGVVAGLAAPVPAAWFDLGWSVAIGLAVAWTLGVGWRVVAPAFAALLLTLLSYRLSWGQIHHEPHLPSLHVLTLALTPASAAVSVDALLRRRLGGSRWLAVCGTVAADAAPSWRWSWPVRAVCGVTAASYVLAGIAKMSGTAGLAWGSAENLLGQIGHLALQQDFLAGGGLPAVRFLYAHPEILGLFGVGTLVIEAGAFLALVDRRLGMLWSVAAFSMHWGIRLVMGIVFPYPMSGLAFASFFPLERLLGRRR